MTRIVCVLVALAALQVPAPAPQQPPQAFRSGVETVAIYATALDRYGNILKSLTRDDFEVFDDGKMQALTVFENGIQPITAMLLMDTSQSMTLNLDLARSAAEQFIVRMLPEDRARVGSFSDAIVISPEFTSDRDALLRSMHEDLQFGNPTRLWDAMDQGIAKLSTTTGRRIILLLTDGDDTYSRETAGAVLTRLKSDDLLVYAVQFRSTALARMEVLPNQGARRTPPPGQGGPSPGALLQQLAAQTGGGYAFLRASDDVNATLARITEELHYQYVLGFSPQTLDGRVHSLDVRVRQAGTIVRSRRTYLAPRRPSGGL